MKVLISKAKEYFYISDELLDIFKEYYYSPAFMSATIPIFNGVYKYTSIFFFSIYGTVVPFYAYLILSTAVSVYKEDFPLFCLEVEIFLLIILSGSLVVIFNVNRKTSNYIHEHLLKGFDYEEENDHVFDGFHARINMSRLRVLLWLVFLLIGLITIYVTFFVGYLDTTFGRGDEIIKLGITLNLPLPIKYPFDIGSSTASYLLAYISQVITFNFIVQCTTFPFMAYIRPTYFGYKQCYLLLWSIEYMNVRVWRLYSKMYGIENNNSLDQKLLQICRRVCWKKVFQHYQFIRKLVGHCQTLQSVSLGSLFLHCGISVALTVFIIQMGGSALPGRAIMAILMTAAEVMICWVMCDLGQLLTDMNEDVRFKIYEIDWLSLPKSLVKDILIMQEMAKKPLAFRLFGIYPIALTSFTDILNTAYSLYSVLRASNQ